MFSQRTRWNRSANAFARRLAAARDSGTSLVDLTLSNPTRAGLTAPPALLSLLGDPDGRFYEPAAAGLTVARRALAAAQARRGLAVAPEDTLLTASTSEAYALLFKLLCDPGDTILAPRPSYPLFGYLADLEGVRLRHYPLRYDGAWHVDLPALRRALVPQVQAVVVVSPNNPTGSYLTPDERDAVQELCEERGIAVVADEVFAEYDLRTSVPPRASPAREDPALTFTLGGLSKSLGLPQLKLAWTVVTGPEAARCEARARLEIIADTYLSVATPVQLALPRLLEQREQLQRPIRQRLTANLAFLRRALADSPATLLEVEAGWSAIVRLPATRSDEEWALALLEDGFVTHPGYFFDIEQPACLVLSLLTPPTDLEAGVAALVARVVEAPSTGGTV